MALGGAYLGPGDFRSVENVGRILEFSKQMVINRNLANYAKYEGNVISLNCVSFEGRYCVKLHIIMF